MANEYRESTVAGTSYQRGRSMYFEYPRNETPSLLVREETVTILGEDRVIVEPDGEILKSIPVAQLGTEFQLRNPATNDAIEGQTATYQDVFILLFSLYWHLAEERDTALATPPEEPVIPPIEPPLAP